MADLPDSLKQVSLFFERLPGIGQKSARRLAFYLLRMPDADLKAIGRQFSDLKHKTRQCPRCHNLTERELCAICDSNSRDPSVITVVEDVIDLLSFENGNIYKGVYHVLHGKIDPLNNVRPEDIFIDTLFTRIAGMLTKHTNTLSEIIIATNPDMEGEATAMYLRNRLTEYRDDNGYTFKITRLGYGMPIGGNLEYTDYMTLKKAMDNRSSF